MKVLVAEDEMMSRCMLESVLSEWGFEVISVADGQAACEVLTGESAPRLAILDWEMPKKSGLDVCRYVRAHPEASRPYLLVLTAREGKANIAAALQAGANDYLSKPFDAIEMRARIDVATSMLELRSLEEASRELERKVEEGTEELARANTQNDRILAAISSVLIGLDSEGRVTKWNKTAAELFGIQATAVLGKHVASGCITWQDPGILDQIHYCSTMNRVVQLKNIPFTRPPQHRGYLDLCITPIPGRGSEPPGVLILGEDRTEQRLLETQLAQSQKLESIGQLAAGIAHEINTPIQYVSDNTIFLRDSFAEITRSLDALRQLLSSAKSGPLTDDLISEADAIVESADIDYLSEEIPKTLEQTLEGVNRVAHIVRAMKNFSHPCSADKALEDLNRLVENTITVARHEWKYVADVITDFDTSLALTPCLIGEFNQVILNLLVNAAHAVGERLAKAGETNTKGTIRVSTRQNGDWAEVRISDTGTGIPEAIRSRVFDPFFTTKPVGRGTGQGLAIAHDVIVGKHGGELTFETEVGKGTTFIIRLPCATLEAERKRQVKRLSVCT
jgi:PAS domain S-box-containing protein